MLSVDGRDIDAGTSSMSYITPIFDIETIVEADSAVNLEKIWREVGVLCLAQPAVNWYAYKHVLPTESSPYAM